MVGKGKGVKYLVVPNYYPRIPSMQKDQKIQGLLSPIIFGCFFYQDSKSSASHQYPHSLTSVHLSCQILNYLPYSALHFCFTLHLQSRSCAFPPCSLSLYLSQSLLLIVLYNLKSPFYLPFKFLI